MATINHINPADGPRNSAFSQAVVVRGAGATIYVGGQNGITAPGAILDGMHAQTEQALRNLEAVAAFAGVWGQRGDPPATTLAVVEALANPRFLIEIEAIAVADGG